MDKVSISATSSSLQSDMAILLLSRLPAEVRPLFIFISA